MKNLTAQRKPNNLQNRIDILEEILKSSAYGEGNKIFYSDSFERTVFEKGYGFGNLKITRDFFPEKQAYLYSASFSAYAARRVQFNLKAENIRQSGASGRVGTFIQEQGHSFLIPNPPVVRRWNKKGHVVYERSDYYAEYESQCVFFEVDFLENESFDLIMLDIPDEGMVLISDVYRKTEKEYTLTGPWVVISPLLDCWRFMIDGNIYEYRKGASREASARFASQQAALFLYQLVSIQEDNAKDLAKIIKDEIAYSVLLSLEDDGRWVHGCWTDEMETHARFQIDGIHLLLDHFEETGEPVFLEKSLLAAGYLLTLTDVLKDGAIWFLHDTLELGKHYISPLVKSRAFKKSETNILCLNTHLSALCALIRLHDKTGKEELKDAIDSGLKAVEMVLKAGPATSLYRVLYSFIDLSFDRPPGASKRFPSPKEALKILLGMGSSRLLPYVKKAFPRFVMPNGFTTRHLSPRNESYSYHIINLYDMLVLYQLLVLNRYEELEYLWDSIDKAVDYCFNGNLIRFLMNSGDRFIPQFVEALVMYAAFNKEFDKKKLVDITLTLKDKGFKFTSGCYGFDNLVTPKDYQVSGVILDTHGPNIESFNTSPRDKGFRELLVINTGSKEEEIDMVFTGGPERLEVISSSGKRIDPPLILDSRDYLLIRVYEK